MSSDLIFWICAAALLLLLEVCLYIGLRSSSKTEVENTGLNRLVYQDQFQTLNQELAEHRISTQNFPRLRLGQSRKPQLPTLHTAIRAG